LVAVEHVTVTGADGPDAAQIRGALVSAARTMSTLDAHLDRLRTAVAPYPVVRDIRVTTQFPHGMRIRVVEEIPVAIVMVNGRPVPVAGDGILLHDAGSAPTLPVLTLSAPPGGPRLTEPLARSAVALLAAAPYPVLAKLSQVSHDAAHGLTAQLRGGPAVYFGDGTEARAKWRAALEVLADPGSAGATYIDVTDPRRPAAGAGGGGSAASAGGSTLSAGGSTLSAGASTMSAAASAASAGGAAASTVGGAGASAAGSTTGAGAASTPTQSTGTAAAPASSIGG
jgi:cell division protein FtsQ